MALRKVQVGALLKCPSGGGEEEGGGRGPEFGGVL